jgi:hypothetical protein
MNATTSAALTGFTNALLLEFIEYQKRRAQVEGWKPSEADVAAFLAEIDADTPEALKAKVAAQEGVEWPPKPEEG